MTERHGDGDEPETGDELWRRDLEANGAAVELRSGDTRWLQPLRGTVDDLQAFDGRMVLATQLSTTIFAEDGSVVARRDPYESLTVTADHLVGWGVARRR